MTAKKAKPTVKKAATQATTKRRVGRPSAYTDKVADAICAQLAEGKSLVTICAAQNMPHRSIVMRWLAQDLHGFRDKYAQAREAQADFYAEQIIDIADEENTFIKRDKDGDDTEVAFDPTAVARNRLRVDARKWYASKVAPKKYGDKLALGGADDLPAIQQVHSMSTEALLAIAAGAVKK